jgi:hypothetical protein
VETPVLVAELAVAGAPSEGAVAVAEPPRLTVLSADDVSLALAKDPPRRGSPFAFDTKVVHTSAQKTWYGEGPYARTAPTGRAQVSSAPLMPHYPRHTSAFGGVIAAFLLGAMGLMVLLFSVFGTVIAALGVGCAVWGLYSKDKRMAFIALILCCLVVMLGCWMIGYSVYQWWVIQALNSQSSPGM